MIRFTMFIVKIIVTVAVALWALTKIAFKAAFVKKDEIRENAPAYKAALKDQFETLDVSDKATRFTGVFDSWKTKLSDYVSSREPEAPKPQPALMAPQKEAA